MDVFDLRERVIGQYAHLSRTLLTRSIAQKAGANLAPSSLAGWEQSWSYFIMSHK